MDITNDEDIEAARKTNDALTDEQKALVPAETVEKLREAEEIIAEIQSIAVTEGETTKTYTKEIDEEVAEQGVNLKLLSKKQ